ncbi:hypothetical protein PV10_08881 [Exophiala mesophila]|uniref:VOC domain-containing protein n=1 Tax=Exophiala mesophila TaxID=212818 RepID=A0A0D1Z5Y6_EXOME|nr:uncharacterized protein PV10_08881 [Exophiala mesophila]KIV89304.1 hypothetical protein PV10_08881 [Exophiala mesophila]
MPLDHICLITPFSKVDDEATFLLTAFAHMGLREYARPAPGVVGLGDDTGSFLWVGGYDAQQRPIPDGATIQRIHIALTAKNHQDVDKFHVQGLKVAGVVDNGAPGPRANYRPDYYGAFLISPAGHNIEAVCHKAPEETPK